MSQSCNSSNLLLYPVYYVFCECVCPFVISVLSVYVPCKRHFHPINWISMTVEVSWYNAMQNMDHKAEDMKDDIMNEHECKIHDTCHKNTKQEYPALSPW